MQVEEFVVLTRLVENFRCESIDLVDREKIHLIDDKTIACTTGNLEVTSSIIITLPLEEDIGIGRHMVRVYHIDVLSLGTEQTHTWEDIEGIIA